MRSTSLARSGGFSLVEMLVALLFMSLLMAGLASVFRGSLSTAVNSSESVSSGRRNRMSMDMLYDDLNQAGMLPTSLTKWPIVQSAYPPFVVQPNQAYTGTDVAAADAKSDQLCFYYDNILPYAGTLSTPIIRATKGQSLQTSATLSFRDDEQAKLVKAGMKLLARADVGYVRSILTATPGTSGTVAVTFPTLENVTDPDQGGGGGRVNVLGGTEVLVVQPARYVRYSIQARNLDPENPARGIPCLVREEVDYGCPFDAAQPSYTTSLVAENVRRFKVYLSADGGQTWAGLNAKSWDDIAADLNTTLATTGRTGYQSVSAGAFWFREIPVVVRVDLTTRTVRKRSEYSATPATSADYKEQTQSLVMIPRHFGLPYNRTLTGA